MDIESQNENKCNVRRYLADFVRVSLDDGLRLLVEGVKPLLDSLHIVVGTAGRLGTLHQPARHDRVGHFEVENQLRRPDL